MSAWIHLLVNEVCLGNWDNAALCVALSPLHGLANASSLALLLTPRDTSSHLCHAFLLQRWSGFWHSCGDTAGRQSVQYAEPQLGHSPPYQVAGLLPGSPLEGHQGPFTVTSASTIKPLANHAQSTTDSHRAVSKSRRCNS